MKKLLSMAYVLMLAAFLLSVAAFAATGPDGSVTVKPVETILKQATCDKGGIKKVVTGDVTTYERIPALGHLEKEVVENLEKGDCTDPESVDTYDAVLYCTRCNKVLDSQKQTRPASHTKPEDESLVEIVKPTCGEDGSESYTCVSCGEDVVDVLPATGEHAELVEGYIEATCTTNAKAGMVCPVCYLYGEDLEEIGGTMLAHKWELDTTNENYKPATCVAGLDTFKCVNCDATDEVATDPVDEHDYVEVEKLAATCGEAGHEAGVKCSVCGDVKSGCEEISATGEHDMVSFDAVASTCMTKGHEAGAECSVCGYTTGGEERELDASNHEFDLSTTLRAATCTTNGVGKYVCKNPECSATTYKVITAAHSYEDAKTEVTEEPSCVAAGEGKVVCTVCGEGEEIVEIEPLGHHYVLKSETPATCGDKGKKVYVCDREGCDETVTGHTFVLTLRETNKHDYAEEVDVEATCTEPAKVGKVCTVCGAQKEMEAIEGSEPLGHDYVTKNSDPTCTENAKSIITCSRCDLEPEEVDLYKETENDLYKALGHREVAANIEGTCKTKAVTGRTVCEVCGEVVEAGTEGKTNPNKHELELGPTLRKATCTTSGIGKYVCANGCDYKEYKMIPAAHTWDDGVVKKEATCVDAGEALFTCTVCGKTETREIPATGEHTYEDDVVVEATCTEPEKIGRACTVCGEPDGEMTEIGEPLSHDFVLDEDESVAATCTNSGKNYYVCSRCDETCEEDVPALGHKYETSYEDATCEHNALKIEKCSVCGDEIETDLYTTADGTVTEEALKLLKKKDHTLVAMEDVEATCSTVGSKGGKKCSVCGAVIEQPSVVEIDANAHSYELTVTLRKPTCTAEGYGKYTCEYCEGTKYDVIAMIDHSWGEEQVDDNLNVYQECTVCGEKRWLLCEHANQDVISAVAATCTTTGLTEGKKCTLCGAIIVAQNEVPALGHTWDDGEVTTPATCTENGEKTYTCKDCDDTQKKVITATGAHDWTKLYVTQYAQCGSGGTGKVLYECSNCKETETRDVSAATAHNYKSVTTNMGTYQVCQNELCNSIA